MADGLQIQRRVIAGAPRWLAPSGHLLIETSERQALLQLHDAIESLPTSAPPAAGG